MKLYNIKVGEEDMQSIRSYAGSGASTKQIIMKLGGRGVISSTPAAHAFFSFKNSLHRTPKSKAQPKLVAAKKHSEAEKRRRLRINFQYTTLRTILPNLIKVRIKLTKPKRFYFSNSYFYIYTNI